MSLLGIIASSKFGDVGDFESIATVSVGSGGSLEIDFTSIPSTFQHLQLRGLYRQANGEAILMRFNGDTANNYACHALYGDGSSAAANAAATRGNIPIERNGGMPTGANIFGGAVIDILDYKDTSKYKTIRSLSGHDNNGSGYVQLESGLWQDTDAITSIKLFTAGNVYAQYSQFALYGIRSA
jgi:hypothetical protein